MATGHGDSIIVENFVGNIDLGGDTSADSQQTGMKIRTVTHVLEDMTRFGEWEMPYPVRALAPHMGMGVGVSVHIGSHVVTTDPTLPSTAFRQLGRCVVWAARTEIRHAGNSQILALCCTPGLPIQEHQTGCNPLTSMKMGDAPCQHAGDLLSSKLTTTRQYFIAVLIHTAHHSRTLAIG